MSFREQRDAAAARVRRAMSESHFEEARRAALAYTSLVKAEMERLGLDGPEAGAVSREALRFLDETRKLVLCAKAGLRQRAAELKRSTAYAPPSGQRCTTETHG